MSGITGIWNVNSPVQKKTLSRFNNALRHRGPDSEGYYLSPDGCLGLGHRRLSVIDLSSLGNQPMSTPDKRYWVTHNGAIYNYPEIRQELKGAGTNFFTETDTEVILSAYALWGEDCLLKFNGMWAFSIWDEQDQSLFLSRDRFGIKPLYYLYLPNKLFAFASETAAFRHLDGFEREFDRENVALCLRDPSSFEITGRSLFKYIRQIPPGHWLKYSHSGGLILHRWWRTRDHLRAVPTSYEDQVKEFKSLFKNACKIRLRCDVPFAITLSGGVDSSSVYSMVRSILSDNGMDRTVHHGTPTAFIASFPGTEVDEREYADKVLDHYGSSGVHVTVDSKILTQQILNNIIHGEYIYFTPEVFNVVYRSMRENSVVVSIGGHGSDEQLMGYWWYPFEEILSDTIRDDTLTKREMFKTISYLVPRNQWDAIAPILAYSIVMEHFTTILPPQIVNHPLFMTGMRLMCGLYRRMKQPKSPAWSQGSNWLTATFDECHKGDNVEELPDFFSNAEKNAYRDFHATILPITLRNGDRISMQHGIEERNPFLDWRLVCYVFSLPLSAKIGGGLTKRILRDAMAGIMPEFIRTERLKRPFQPPVIQWLNHDLDDFIQSEVNSPEFLLSDIWDGPAIRDYAINHCERKSWKAGNYEKFWYIFAAHLLLKYAK